MLVMCVSCSSLHTVIPAGEAAVCTPPNGLSLVVKELQYFPVGLPVTTRYYKNTWTWQSLWFPSAQCRHDNPAVDSKEVEC